MRHVAPALGALRRRYAFWGVLADVLGAFWARFGLGGLQNAPPSGYRITAHDGHLASCDGNKQAIAPVEVPPRRFLAVSYLGAFCFNSVVSSNRKDPNRHNFAEKIV